MVQGLGGAEARPGTCAAAKHHSAALGRVGRPGKTDFQRSAQKGLRGARDVICMFSIQHLRSDSKLSTGFSTVRALVCCSLQAQESPYRFPRLGLILVQKGQKEKLLGSYPSLTIFLI